jgi:RNA polymerase sigma factor (sigma-70 family)
MIWTDRPPVSLEDEFARHEAELLGVLGSLVGDREDARDALQEAFVKCWRRRDQAPQVRNLKAWIFRVALNAGRDVRKTAWRRKRQPLSHDDAALCSTHSDPQWLAMRAEQQAHVASAVEALREEEKTIFLLRQHGDLTYEEIAEALSLPTGTIKTRMRLAVAKVRAAVA